MFFYRYIKRLNSRAKRNILLFSIVIFSLNSSMGYAADPPGYTCKKIEIGTRQFDNPLCIDSEQKAIDWGVSGVFEVDQVNREIEQLCDFPKLKRICARGIKFQKKHHQIVLCYLKVKNLLVNDGMLPGDVTNVPECDSNTLAEVKRLATIFPKYWQPIQTIADRPEELLEPCPCYDTDALYSAYKNLEDCSSNNYNLYFNAVEIFNLNGSYTDWGLTSDINGNSAVRLADYGVKVLGNQNYQNCKRNITILSELDKSQERYGFKCSTSMSDANSTSINITKDIFQDVSKFGNLDEDVMNNDKTLTIKASCDAAIKGFYDKIKSEQIVNTAQVSCPCFNRSSLRQAYNQLENCSNFNNYPLYSNGFEDQGYGLDQNGVTLTLYDKSSNTSGQECSRNIDVKSLVNGSSPSNFTCSAVIKDNNKETMNIVHNSQNFNIPNADILDNKNQAMKSACDAEITAFYNAINNNNHIITQKPPKLCPCFTLDDLLDATSKMPDCTTFATYQPSLNFGPVIQNNQAFFESRRAVDGSGVIECYVQGYAYAGISQNSSGVNEFQCGGQFINMYYMMNNPNANLSNYLVNYPQQKFTDPSLINLYNTNCNKVINDYYNTRVVIP